jgi:hypothetical protein
MLNQFNKVCSGPGELADKRKVNGLTPHQTDRILDLLFTIKGTTSQVSGLFNTWDKDAATRGLSLFVRCNAGKTKRYNNLKATVIKKPNREFLRYTRKVEQN